MSSDDILSLPKVLLMGLRKSGKSSIQKVVFEGMQPHESANLPTTVQPEKSTVHSNDFVNFEIWDFPGQSDPFSETNPSRYDVEQLLDKCGAIVFVMDCRELIDDSRARLLDTICAVYRYDPELFVEVFIHKVDALSEDHQADLLTGLQRRVEEEAKQRLENTTALRLNFNLTSIYDYSVFQAFSLVVQKLIRRQAPYFTELLQMLNSNSNLDLSYLFLSRSKIFLAVDERNRLKARTYDLCSDAIEVIVSCNRIYSSTGDPFKSAHTMEGGPEGDEGASGVQAENCAGNMGDSPCSLGTGTRGIISLGNKDCIYVRELPNSLTIVSMMKKEDLCNRTLIDQNISLFYDAIHSLFSA